MQNLKLTKIYSQGVSVNYAKFPAIWYMDTHTITTQYWHIINMEWLVSTQDWHTCAQCVICPVSSLHSPPGEKWSAKLSQISGVYYPKAVRPMRLWGQ